MPRKPFQNIVRATNHFKTQYIAPFLLATTTVANTLIVVVLSRRHMRTPTNIVLMAMALCDMLTMLFPAPWLFYMYTFGNHYKPLTPPPACTAWNYMNEVIPAMFHTASIWLTLALAVQRYIYVCHAPVARTWCTMPRVIKCLIYIGLAAFLHQLPRFFDRRYVPHVTVWRGQLKDVCQMEMAPWVKTISLDAYFIAYFAFRVLFVHLIPCTSLVVLNVLLFRAMKKAQINRQKLFKDNRKSEYSDSSSECSDLDSQFLNLAKKKKKPGDAPSAPAKAKNTSDSESDWDNDDKKNSAKSGGSSSSGSDSNSDSDNSKASSKKATGRNSRKPSDVGSDRSDSSKKKPERKKSVEAPPPPVEKKKDVYSEPEEGEVSSHSSDNDSMIDSEEEFDDGYDENLMGDEEDRARLAAMSEKEREQEIFKRIERRDLMKTRGPRAAMSEKEREQEIFKRIVRRDLMKTRSVVLPYPHSGLYQDDA
ncbi:unnamed protein product [Plutella xylostella]|uniref:(diamondback moth) hypothetical protein n=1 Tax=Plutella xylostella TaxID=51655 RepID=A0A8S4ENE1_PLUXY|nr:unnamed protein product [Plutella xylostella]